MKGRPYFSPSLLGCTIRRHWREFVLLATNREALADRIAVVSFCLAFRHLAKQRGGGIATTVSGEYADAEPVIYDVVPYFGSRNHNGWDEVEIYADVSATIRRAEYRLRDELQARDDAAYVPEPDPWDGLRPHCPECGAEVERGQGPCGTCVELSRPF